MLNNEQKYEGIKKVLEKWNDRIQPTQMGINSFSQFDSLENMMMREVLGIIDQLAEDLYLLKKNNENIS